MWDWESMWGCMSDWLNQRESKRDWESMLSCVVERVREIESQCWVASLIERVTIQFQCLMDSFRETTRESMLSRLSDRESHCSAAFMYMTCLSHMWLHLFICDVTQSYMTRLTQPKFVSPYVWHDSSVCVTWLIRLSHQLLSHDVTHSYMWRDAFICNMTHSHVTWLNPTWQDSSSQSSWVHVYVTRRDQFICE